MIKSLSLAAGLILATSAFAPGLVGAAPLSPQTGLTADSGFVTQVKAKAKAKAKARSRRVYRRGRSLRRTCARRFGRGTRAYYRCIRRCR